MTGTECWHCSRAPGRAGYAICLLVTALAGCNGGPESVLGPPRCLPPADGSASFGCAVVSGQVVGPQDQPLDGIEGAVRPTPQCACELRAIQVDSMGRFSITIHRRINPMPRPSPDTATVVVFMSASAPKYPRHVTGAAYFDTLSVVLNYALPGGVVTPIEVLLRIPLPAS
jgi:hypothetical protein